MRRSAQRMPVGGRSEVPNEVQSQERPVANRSDFFTQMLGISLAPALVPKYLFLFLGGWLVGMIIGTWPIYKAIKTPEV
jgi:hypothetical protein